MAIIEDYDLVNLDYWIRKDFATIETTHLRAF